MSLKNDLENIVDGKNDATNFSAQLMRIVFKADLANKSRLIQVYRNLVATVDTYQRIGVKLDLPYDSEEQTKPQIVLTVLNVHIPGCGKPPGLEPAGRCYTAYFENEELEQLVFRYDYDLKRGTLWHGDYNWERPVKVENGHCPLILSREEEQWLQLVWQVAIKRVN